MAVVALGIGNADMPNRVTTFKTINHWVQQRLLPVAINWYQRTRKRLGPVSERSSWWSLAWSWNRTIGQWMRQFCYGWHRFSPMIQYRFTDEVVRVWSRQFTRAKKRLRLVYDQHCLLRNGHADAVNPANVQRYLSRWASWWKSVIRLEYQDVIFRWICFTETIGQADVTWLGRGLLLNPSLDGLSIPTNQHHMAC